MNRIGICGHYGGNKVFLDGQTIKTKVLTQEVENTLGEECVLKMDTYGGKKKLFSHIIHLIKLFYKCKSIIILPAYNSLRIFAPILVLLNMFNTRKLYYVVIGGWLPDYLVKKKWLIRILVKFDCIFVETSTMKNRMEKLGLTNVEIVPNCKYLKVLKSNCLRLRDKKPFDLCTFSRVTKEKGIEDAIEAVKRINIGNDIKYTLTIYGQVDPQYENRFRYLEECFPSYIRYGGEIPFEDSVNTVKDYFALLFPTRFKTEGIPGTILDAYASGVPVISARWQSYADLVFEGETGLGYEIGDIDDLIRILNIVADNPCIINDMKKNCLTEVEKYLPWNAFAPVIERL